MLRNQPIVQRLTSSNIWKSVFRHGWPDNPLDRSLIMTQNFFLHLHSVKVSRKSLKATYSFGLGLLTTFSFIGLAITGTLLMFYYVPSVERAFVDIVELQTKVPFGQLMRNMHRWGAHLMVIMAVLHMIRVFFTGAYKPPREFNWIIGVLLLILTLGASFTGYLLPWDQLSYWAITVGTSIAGYVPIMGALIQELLLGGAEVGQESLVRFYALHVIVIPALLVLLISVHLWRVRKDGGMAASEISDENQAS
jgi:quinol-cytochrome oxidoreductase complex cytochrome b subunit